MRILVVHNAYQRRGGEDAVMEAEVALLRRRGDVVEQYLRSNDEAASASSMALARDTVWSTRTTREIEELIAGFKPDVIHAHNTFPLVSPSLYWVASRLGVPMVQTLHNFRVACLNALFLRDERVCEDCLGRVPWRGVIRGCYRGSRKASAALAGALTTHRAMGTYRNKVSRYIALNHFSRKKFIESGLPAHRIVVKPNFVDWEDSAEAVATRLGFLFVGRLSVEKGISTLVEAMAHSRHCALRVAGDGPLAPLFEGISGVDRTGVLDADGVRSEMLRAAALVVPSICYENFPRSIAEAFSCGLPVIASRIGALAEIVRDGETGLLFEPKNARDLADKMAWAQTHPHEMAQMGRNARAQYEAEFSPEVNYRQLMQIYADVVAERRQGALSPAQA